MIKLDANILPQSTVKLIEELKHLKPKFLEQFYLSGGTALALQLGHRESEDLDFFSQHSFKPLKLQQQLEIFGQLKNLELATGTLNTFLKSVKLQFLEYPYPLIEETIDWQGIRVSSIVDVACTKLQTVSMRGSKKDFVDLFFILKSYSLQTLFKKLKQKYSQTDYSVTHILKSLVYFEEAQQQPMPRMHQRVSWDEIKTEISKLVKNFQL